MINLLLFRSTLFWTNQLPLTLIWTELVGGLECGWTAKSQPMFFSFQQERQKVNIAWWCFCHHTHCPCVCSFFLFGCGGSVVCQVSPLRQRVFCGSAKIGESPPLTNGMIAYICKTGLKPWTIRCSIFECWGLWFNMHHALCLSHIASSTNLIFQAWFASGDATMGTMRVWATFCLLKWSVPFLGSKKNSTTFHQAFQESPACVW